MKSFLYYFCLFVLSLLAFLHGFFPMQPNQVVDSTELPASLSDINFNTSHLYKQEVDRLIIIVIDALRKDFINNQNMPFLTSTYPTNGCMLTIKVETPTVTLPRIKALTTGSIPQFADIILNLASTEVITDSILHRALEAKKKILFYGDDTWLKLYPKIFERFEGVSSFYVNDYTVVDNNVTRNVLKELNQNDWDVLVLHYLGLDHIGHVYGPYSHLIPIKLKEMDRVIEKIFLTSKEWNQKTLIAITGDHGMKDSGGHGGSTPSEVYVPFICVGITCKDDSAAQSDLPSTLAALMGIKIPTNSIGRIVTNMLSEFSLERVLYVLRYNVLLLLKRTVVHEDLFEKASMHHELYLKSKNKNDGETARQLYENCSKETSETLLHSSIKQNTNNLLVSTMILLCCFCILLRKLLDKHGENGSYTESITLSLALLLQFTFSTSVYATVLNFITSTVILLNNLIRLLKSYPQFKSNSSSLHFFLSGNVLHLLSLLSSSFIEEEHQVWYFLWSTFLLAQAFKIFSYFETCQWFLLLVLLRFLRTINQTGDKWAHLPDLAQWLLLEKNHVYLQVLFCIGLASIPVSCYTFFSKQKFASISSASIILLVIYAFRTYYSQNSFLGKLIWFLIVLNLIVNVLLNKYYLENVIIAWTLVCTLLLRPYNVILLPACIFSSLVIHRYIKNVTLSTITHIWLGKMLFFCQGHSNSLASVDIASGYIGLQEYIPLVVIPQVLCHTYAFPVLCNFLVLRNYLSQADKVWKINIIHRLSIVIVTCILILIQRHHLFVWSVFAPKLLIESCNTLMLFIEIILFYCVIIIKYFLIK